MSVVITHQNLFYVPKICPSATPNLLFSMQIYIQRNFLKKKKKFYSNGHGIIWYKQTQEGASKSKYK